MAAVPDCAILESELKLKSRNNVRFWTNNSEKSIKTPYSLDICWIVALRSSNKIRCFSMKQQTKFDMQLNKETKPVL